jgi:pyruvate/2-oxoglutarate dehydrogenase complex dihydrolipoamide acyltransferase (E2) component
MDKIGHFETKPFTKDRKNIILVTQEGKRRRASYALLEIDVTNARKIMHELKEEKGDDVSFTGWIVKCVAQAVSEHKQLNTYRQGRNKLVVFDDVDIPIPVERMMNNKPILMAYIIRKANEKTVIEITKEIRSVQTQEVDASLQVLGDQLTRGEKFLLHAPLFLKKLGIVILRRNGVLKKKHLGTVGVTAIGMKGRFPGWVIGMGGPIATLIAVGGITKKPGVINDTIMVREYLHLTIHIDHDVVDGGPLARFVSRLTELLETGYGLSG